MSIARRSLSLSAGTAFAIAVLFSLSTAARAQDPKITYAADPDAEKNMTLLLTDWAPKPMLHVPHHEVGRAKFYVVDMHNHVNDPGGVHGEEVPAAAVVKHTDEVNVRKVVILTAMWGEKLQGVLDKMVRPYPDRFIVFTQMDWNKIDDPNFGGEMLAQLDDSVKRGAREAELGRQPRRAFKFFSEVQDGIMFGTDFPPTPAMYGNCFRWLETEDEYFPYWDYPAQGRRGIYGLGLPDGIVKKVYDENAEKVFAQFHGGK